MVDAQPTLGAVGVGELDDHALGLLEHRNEVSRRVLPVVHLGIDDRAHLALVVRDVVPLEAVEVHDLAARRPARRLVTWHIGLVLDIYGLGAGDPLVLDEDVGTGADAVRDLFVGVGLGKALRHHERDVGAHLPERGEHETPGLLELDGEGEVVYGLHRLDDGHHLLAHAVAITPTLDGGDAVVGGYRAPVVPIEPLAELDGVGLAVLAHGGGLRHLRMDLELLVRGEEGVPDHVAVVAADVGRRPDRVDVLEVRVDHRLETRCCRRAPVRRPRRPPRPRRRFSVFVGASLVQILRRMESRRCVHTAEPDTHGFAPVRMAERFECSAIRARRSPLAHLRLRLPRTTAAVVDPGEATVRRRLLAPVAEVNSSKVR